MGTHLVVDAWNVPSEILNDAKQIRQALLKAITAGEATLIDLCVHQFSPYGVTATATLAESHMPFILGPNTAILQQICFFVVQESL